MTSQYKSLYYLTILYFIFIILNKTVCFAMNIGDEFTSESSVDLMDTINVIKDKAKEIGINRPEDIPQVKDWMEECKKIVGGRTMRVIKQTPNRIFDCVKENIKFDELQKEIDDHMKRGELELVFKKYCGRREPIMKCIDEVLELVKPCLNDQQLSDLNVTREAIDAGIDFTCHENGDRIALFLAEDGVQCVKNNSDEMRECIESRIPEVKKAEDDPDSINVDQFLINEENCKKIDVAHDCVVKAAEKCDDPTPANILGSLIKEALKVSPCAQPDTSSVSPSIGFNLHFWAILPHVLILMFSGLTAAHLLL